MRSAPIFVLLSAIGVFEAFYHAWLENAFTTAWSSVPFAPYASFFGLPDWAFGVVWIPLVLVAGAWWTRLGRAPLPSRLLILLTVGNLFTGYLWFVDLLVIQSFNAAYVGLYATNYALTGLVVAENWSRSSMRDFAAGTALGMVVGVFFGAFGAALLGIAGGIFGAVSGYTAST